VQSLAGESASALHLSSTQQFDSDCPAESTVKNGVCRCRARFANPNAFTAASNDGFPDVVIAIVGVVACEILDYGKSVDAYAAAVPLTSWTDDLIIDDQLAVVMTILNFIIYQRQLLT